MTRICLVLALLFPMALFPVAAAAAPVSVDTVLVAQADTTASAATDAPAPILDELAATKAAYDRLKEAKDKDAKLLAWAALIAVLLKLALSVLHRLFGGSKPRRWLAWTALAAAVPIALLSHYALGNGLFDSLVLAGAGPGAILVTELMKLIAPKKA